MTGKKLQERKKRWEQLYQKLSELFPDQKTMLDYSNTWELVVAVILSAQCTDRQVNKVTKDLFKKYPHLRDYVVAGDTKEGRERFEKMIYSTGFYKSKAKNILLAANIVMNRFDGVVPDTIDELVQLPGVGRKTANVVIQNAYNKAEGIAVDTHVRRFAIRYDLSDYTDPLRIERDLMEIIPPEQWISAAYFMINYGREIAPARTYDTGRDPLLKIYPPAAQRFRI